MWNPDLVGDAPTLTARLVATIARDIGSGRLAPGTRLPTHRDLARTLGIGIGTVTAAYAQAARDGLIAARVGSGSYVLAAAPAAETGGRIALSHNVPPLAPAAKRFAAALATIRQRADLNDMLEYAPPAGFDSHRAAGARWLMRSGGPDSVDPARLVVTTGGQHALALALQILCRPGDTLLTEAATFFGVKTLAQHMGYQLAGIAMDAEGLLPDALDAAAAQGARVLYTIPTLQNPTGRILSAARRAEIAGVARRRDLWIVEDDVYGMFARGTAPPPLASFCPERTLYVSGLSKAIAPGLRTGYLLAPDAATFDRIAGAVRALSYAPPGLGSLIASQWIEDGTADLIATEIGAEIAARTALARAEVGDRLAPAADPRCPHLWLPMPELDAERLVARAFRAGVDLTPASAPIVAPGAIAGVRLCVGAPQSRDQVATALRRLAGFLDHESAGGDLALV